LERIKRGGPSQPFFLGLIRGEERCVCSHNKKREKRGGTVSGVGSSWGTTGGNFRGKKEWGGKLAINSERKGENGVSLIRFVSKEKKYGESVSIGRPSKKRNSTTSPASREASRGILSCGAGESLA